MAQVAGEDGLVPTLGTRVVLGQQWGPDRGWRAGLGASPCCEHPLCYGPAVEGREW